MECSPLVSKSDTPLTPKRTVADRILDVIQGIDMLYVVVLLACLGLGVWHWFFGKP